MFQINKKFIIIAGCSSFGATLAEKLISEGNSIVIMDPDNDSFQKLSNGLKEMTVTADATDTDALIDAGIRRADAVISVTENDNTNIMIAEIAKDLFDVKTVAVKLSDVRKEIAFEGSDIRVISPSILSANEFEKILKDEKAVVTSCM
jgi:trk system potassium uptake protein TrkA